MQFDLTGAALVIALPTFRPGQLVQLLGISSVAIGFAFRDILQNFLAGILLLLTEPFKIGDQIRFGDYEGIVEDIQTRATMIRTYDSRRIVIGEVPRPRGIAATLRELPRTSGKGEGSSDGP